MLTFLIKPPGHQPYQGIFASNEAAAHDAQQRFPDAPPASVINLHFTSGHADFLHDPGSRFLTLDQPELTDAEVLQFRARPKSLITAAQEAR